MPPRRPRYHQPGFGSSALLTALLFRGMNHDYVYYDKPYEVDGKTYQPGYYDENGTRYDNLMMKNADGSNTLILTCDYCGTTTKLDWKEGEVPHCSHCGAPLDVEKAQKDNISSSGSYNSETAPETKAKKKSSCLKWILFGLGLIMCLSLFRSCGKTVRPQEVSVRPTNTVQSILPTAPPTSDTMTSVPAGGTIRLGQNADGSYYLITDGSTASKILKWDANSDSYYDPETNTYFWYNTDLENPVWQYWVEGVSSDYGDYGWMEYNNGKWYVEVSDGNWREYTGNPSGFWYITDKKTDITGSSSSSAFQAGSKLRLKRNEDGTYIVLEGSRGRADKVITYDPETESYYDKETDTYIWYNSDASQWQYWVEGLSSDYGDAGWMEYNDGQWYIETRPGSWVKYTDDNGTLWYIVE
jgi:hypothetical protein